MESTSASQVTTGTTRHAVVPQLRSVDIPLTPLRITPRPTPPKQRLHARPVARDLYDSHAALSAFGDGDDGSAA